MVEVETFAAYINARISGMRSALFPRERIENLLTFDDLNRVSDDLLSSPYGTDLAESLTRLKAGEAIEDAIERNLVRTFQALMKLVEGPAKPLTERFLARWDLASVKSLLRMRHHDLDASEPGMLTPGPSLGVPLMRTFAGKNSMEELVHALVAWKPELCAPLEAALPRYRQENNLGVLEESMDRAYFTRGVAELKSNDDVDCKIVCGALRMEIDRINLRALLQFRDAHGSGEGLSNRILPGGWLSMRLLREMAGARDAAHAMEFLANTPYRELVEELYAFVRAARFSPMDRHFDLLMIRNLQHEKHVHVMSIATLMHYAWLKYNEAINLRLVACGTACHLPHGKIREEMMHA